jgi:hypothetical protein
MSIKTHVSALSKDVQQRIVYLLRMNGCFDEDIQQALSGRLCDLKDTIDIDEVVCLC